MASRGSLQADVDGFFEVFSNLVRYYQYRDRDRQCCGGLSVTEWHALDTAVSRGELSIGELGQVLRMDKSSASRLAATLEKQALLERRPDPSNHRVWRIS